MAAQSLPQRIVPTFPFAPTTNTFIVEEVTRTRALGKVVIAGRICSSFCNFHPMLCFLHMSKPIRTRIAPSPTGDPHVGTAYMALFNLAYARRHGGSMILRIEDTDRQRSTEKSEKAILDALKWLGLAWDEGPDCGGDFGPYRQSERLEIHQREVERLIKEGHAYRCFCSQERLDELRKTQIANKETPRYDGRCLNLTEEEIQAKLAAGEPYVVRLKVPTEGVCVFEDELRGEVSIDWKQIDHQILQKSDGYPTYHLANVVDDHLMGITHVIRGEEWISSTPKHVLLYQALGWEPPVFAHLPLLRNPDKSKLSKAQKSNRHLLLPGGRVLARGHDQLPRHDGVHPTRSAGNLFLNELSESFDLKRMSLGGPIFDLAKLKWLNGRYLRKN